MQEGNFIWYELATSDPAAAADFYGKVAGWQNQVNQAAGFDYTVFQVPGYEMGVAGMMALIPDMVEVGVPPHWMGYVYVKDVDAKAGDFTGNGGTIKHPPSDIPNIGRFAVVSDPQGAVICLFSPLMPDGPMPPAPDAMAPGTFGWRELYAGEGASAFDFYAKMFGWEKDMAVDMGAMGSYQTFKPEGGVMTGGIMTKMPEMPMPFWNYYVNVDAIDAAAERVKSNGGQVINGPHPVPAGSWIVNCLDPQGAMFSLVAPGR